MISTSSASNLKPGQFERQDERDRMVKTQIETRGLKNTKVLDALRAVPRHLFVPEDVSKMAYNDAPLPIGEAQTISQPYIVAFMTDAAELKPTDKVLEVGTGSGYQTAVLAELVKEVYTIEIRPTLQQKADALLKQLKYKNVHAMKGDGYKGWPEHKPFDVIFVTAAPEHIPEPLVEQLRVGGRFIIPVGGQKQYLVRVTKTNKGLEQESLLPVSFVPMKGLAEKEQITPSKK